MFCFCSSCLNISWNYAIITKCKSQHLHFESTQPSFAYQYSCLSSDLSLNRAWHSFWFLDQFLPSCTIISFVLSRYYPISILWIFPFYYYFLLSVKLMYVLKRKRERIIWYLFSCFLFLSQCHLCSSSFFQAGTKPTHTADML